TQVSENQYAVTVKDGHMEIVFSGMFGVDAINSVLMNDYFNRTYWKPEYRAMDDGQTLFIAKKEVVYIGQDLTDKTDVTMPMVQTYEPADQFVEKATGSNYRIMFHNVWGATNEYCGARAQLIIAVYETYQPDVIGLQEASSYWNTTGGKEAVETWLLENGYSEIRYDQGTARPIFYKTDKFTLTKSGALRTPTGYGVTWAVFKDKATGKTFGVTNTHMTADSVTDDDHDKGTMARVTDAETVLEAIKEIHKVSKNCAVISGGDYNAAYGDIYIDDEGTEFDAMATLTDGGATNVRDLVVEDGYCTPYGGMSGGGDYYEAYGVYSFKTWTGGKPENAVDHILYAGGENNATIHQYVLLTDVVSASASDHVPHFVDISVK
ncbi:MAG: hypothetical protein IJY42_01455, partial [Clostridia bacterium]|nr:hypothetical protein [Clostridia bacterium]